MIRIITAALLAQLAWGGRPIEPTAAQVMVAAYSGVINPASAEYLTGAVSAAAQKHCAALVIELDTPGGLDLSMREIVKAILASEVPVIVYVAPAGARAASAGVFIAMAAHVAAMTPGTNIGAAHPVQIGGVPGAGKEKEKVDAAMEGKITNDAAAYLQAIASRRGRNVQWAFEVVSRSTSVVSSEAVRLKVVDMEADNLQDLLRKADGKILPDFKGRPVRTKDAGIIRLDMTPRQKLLATVADPNIAMILMTLGVSGLLIELYSPGLILPGIVGAISLILAFYSFQTLSASFAGVLLILFGFLLYVLEIKITSYGLLAVSGTAAILFGAMMLFRDSGGVSVSWSVLASTVATLAALVLALIALTARVFKRRPKTGADGLVGQTAVVREDLLPEGKVALGGELWRAKSLEGNIPKGAEVRVEGAEGLTLTVARKS
ncbi:MAG TPA: serine protease [Elusimicrobia bacterium]|nr:serine protease [Elusimicrobiota bacterium]HBT61867.1 serine protease [Elusimicrobiota bacterium]